MKRANVNYVCIELPRRPPLRTSIKIVVRAHSPCSLRASFVSVRERVRVHLPKCPMPVVVGRLFVCFCFVSDRTVPSASHEYICACVLLDTFSASFAGQKLPLFTVRMSPHIIIIIKMINKCAYDEHYSNCYTSHPIGR